MKTFLLAGNHEEYSSFMNTNNQHPVNITYLHSPEQIMGTRAGIIIVYGTYDEVDNIKKNEIIIQTAKQRDFLIMKQT